MQMVDRRKSITTNCQIARGFRMEKKKKSESRRGEGGTSHFRAGTLIPGLLNKNLVATHACGDLGRYLYMEQIRTILKKEHRINTEGQETLTCTGE